MDMESRISYNAYNYQISGRMPKFDMKILKQKHQTINCGNDNMCNGFKKKSSMYVLCGDKR